MLPSNREYILYVSQLPTLSSLFLGEEHEEKVKLEEEKRAADEKYRYKRRQIKELQGDIQVERFSILVAVKGLLYSSS